MKILVVAATELEVKGLLKEPAETGVPYRLFDVSENSVDVLITGVGAVPTAFCLARFVEDYDFILNVGIAGSYSSNINIGQVVVVDWDCFGDYGIDNNGHFISLSEVGFADASSNVNNLSNPWLNKIDIPEYLVKVKGITLGTASGSEQSIGKIKQLWNPDIETMESAAVFYVCLLLDKPFICLRAISNFVEPRNKSKWRIKEALDNLNTEVIKFISSRIEII